MTSSTHIQELLSSTQQLGSPLKHVCIHLLESRPEVSEDNAVISQLSFSFYRSASRSHAPQKEIHHQSTRGSFFMTFWGMQPVRKVAEFLFWADLGL